MRFKSRTRAMAVAALAATVSLAGLTTVASPVGAAPAETDRVAGTDRYGTAAEAAERAYPTGADTVVVTTGEKIPDALSANPIAGENDGPILLVQENAIPAVTQAAMAELDPTNVIIVGGTSVVSDTVEAAIAAEGITVTREAGEDRFETAAEVARAVGEAPAIDADGAGSQTAMPTVALANGLNGLADAVSASPMLHQEEIPLLLTSGDTLNEDAAAAIDELGATQVLVLGGTAVIPATVIDELEQMGLDVEVLAGGTRFETATAIADFEVDFLGFDAARTFIASGFSLVDALAGGPLASVENGPIVLVSETDVPTGTATWITENADDIDEIVAIGGTAVINDSTLAEAAALADGDETPTATGVTIRPELVSAQIVSTTTTALATGTNPAGTVVQFTFDEAVGSPDISDFNVYTFAGAPGTPGDALRPNTTGDNRHVFVLFSDFDTAAEASQLSVAAVNTGAVLDANANTNPEGDAAIGASGTTPAQAGRTSAPDLVSVGSFRPVGTASGLTNYTAVDFTFDQAAWLEATTGFHLVLVNPVTPGGTNNVLDCITPTPGNAASEPGGTPNPGGEGTTTITVACENPGTIAAPGTPRAEPITTGEVARGVVEEGSVRSGAATPAGTDSDNPLQAADVSGASSTPDLVSVTFLAADATMDIATYTFDEPVSVVGGEFRVYDTAGNETVSITVLSQSADGRSVAVAFPNNRLNNAVGGSVDEGTVASTTGTVGRQNRADEEGATPVQPSSFTAGRTAGPDLTGVTLAAQPDPFGQTAAYVATYTFDEDVTAATASSLYLYLADGTQLQCTGTASVVTGEPQGSNNVVRCSQYTIGSGTQAGASATIAQVGSAVLGTVLEGAVTAADTGPSNPIGAEATTGGTGTPAA